MRKSSKYLVVVLLASLSLEAQTFHKVPGLDIRGYPQLLDTFQNELVISGPIYFPWTIFPFENNDCIATWKDSVQFPLDSGLGGIAQGSAVFQNKLLVGGNYTAQGWEENQEGRLNAWDGLSWFDITPGPQVQGSINAICTYNNEVYVAGQFTAINGMPALDIAKWDGTNWTTVGPGFIGNCYVNCMQVYNGELYVGGYLGLPNGPNNYYYHLVKWNGTQWDSVGGKFDWVVYDLEVDSSTSSLYAGGIFSYCPSGPAQFLAHYDGITWSQVGDDTINTHFIRGGIHALEIFESNLYAGGYPNMNPTDTVLSFWDGTTWTQLPAFLNADVRCMQVFDSNLYIGGYIPQVVMGDTSAHWIVCYGNSCPTSTVGITENSNLKSLTLFPNPTSDIITVDLGDMVPVNYQVRVVDAKGREVYLQELNMSRTTINVSGWTSGTYFFTVLDENLSTIAQAKTVISN